MLTALSIRDIVLIEKLDLALERGLTVLTGETGVGGILVARMQGDEALGRVDRLVIGITLILRIGLHELRLGGPG